jgi:WD40 repeat protein
LGLAAAHAADDTETAPTPPATQPETRSEAQAADSVNPGATSQAASQVNLPEQPKLLFTLEGHSQPVFSVAFSRDGKTLVSASGDKTIRLWDVANGLATAILEGHTDKVRAVAFGPDGKTLASGSEDKTIKLWNVAADKATATLVGHTGTVLAVAFGPDGKTLASGSQDATVRLWDVATGKNTGTFGEQTVNRRHSYFCGALSPDGKILAVGTSDKKIKLWQIKIAP